MRDSKVIGGLAGLVILGSVVGVVFELGAGLGPRLDSRPHEAAGWGMAQQTLRLLKPGGQVIVLKRDTSVFKNPATDIQLASFKKALQASHVAIATVHSFQVDALRPVEVPPGDFLEIIRKTPPTDVIVSFMGPPVLSENQRSRLGEAKPGIVAFCSGSLPERVDLAALCGQGLLQAAVISRRADGTAGSRPSSLQGWFDQSFSVITGTDAANAQGASAPSQGTAQ